MLYEVITGGHVSREAHLLFAEAPHQLAAALGQAFEVAGVIDDVRGDENQQVGLGLLGRLVLEQPSSYNFV